MKIITLNTWGGRAGRNVPLSFFEQYRNDTDIFCLQEIWSAPHEGLEGHLAGGRVLDHAEIMTHGLQDISAFLPEFVPYFRPHYLDHYGLLMLVKRKLSVIEEGEYFVYKEKGHMPEGDVGNHARNLQFVTIEREEGNFTVGNFHGLWNGKGKTDTPDRIAQSKKMITFMKDISTALVLCGDFNLLPDTTSLKMFEEVGYRNLIKEFRITSTRTSFYAKTDKFADYVFVSDGVKVNHFQVLPEEVSDHLALAVVIA